MQKLCQWEVNLAYYKKKQEEEGTQLQSSLRGNMGRQCGLPRYIHCKQNFKLQNDNFNVLRVGGKSSGMLWFGNFKGAIMTQRGDNDSKGAK